MKLKGLLGIENVVVMDVDGNTWLFGKVLISVMQLGKFLIIWIMLRKSLSNIGPVWKVEFLSCVLDQTPTSGFSSEFFPCIDLSVGEL